MTVSAPSSALQSAMDWGDSLVQALGAQSAKALGVQSAMDWEASWEASWGNVLGWVLEWAKGAVLASA